LTLSIEEAVGHLRAVEQRKKPPATKDSDGHLLLTEEEWLSCWKVSNGSSSSSDNRMPNSNCNGGKSGGKGKTSGKQSVGSDRKGTAGRDEIYSYCSKKGHWAGECRKKKRDEATQVIMAQGEEEEQSLLLPTVLSSPLLLVCALHQCPQCAAMSTSKSSRCSPTSEKLRMVTGVDGFWTRAPPTT
jgi:hypothetical protein